MQGEAATSRCPPDRDIRLVSFRDGVRPSIRILDTGRHHPDTQVPRNLSNVTGCPQRAQSGQGGRPGPVQRDQLVQPARLVWNGDHGHGILQESEHRQLRSTTDGDDQDVARGRGHVFGVKGHAGIVSPPPALSGLETDGTERTRSKEARRQAP